MPTAEPVVSLLCRICGNVAGNRTLTAREMMFGMRDAFEYVECSACGCVQIAHVPADLGRYYPPEYSAYAAPHREGRVRRALQRMRADHLLGWPNPAGWLMTRRYGVPPAIEYVRHAKVNRSQSVLDIGCGSGELLLGMRSYGFKRLTGVDPFVAGDIDYGNGVRVRPDPGDDKRCEVAVLIRSNGNELTAFMSATRLRQLAAVCIDAAEALEEA